MKNKHLTDLERLEIEHALRQGTSLKRIAEKIGKHHSTLSREILARRTASDKGAFGILSNRCFGQKPFIKDRRPTAAHNHRIFFNEYLLNHMPIWYTIICRWTFSRAENNLRRDIEKGRVYHVRKTGLRRPAHSCALFRLLSPVKSAPRPRQGPKSCPQPTFSDGLNAPPAHLLRQRRIYFVH